MFLRSLGNSHLKKKKKKEIKFWRVFSDNLHMNHGESMYIIKKIGKNVLTTFEQVMRLIISWRWWYNGHFFRGYHQRMMQGTPIHHHRYKGTTSKLLLLINLWAFQKDNFPQFRQNMKMKQDDVFHTRLQHTQLTLCTTIRGERENYCSRNWLYWYERKSYFQEALIWWWIESPWLKSFEILEIHQQLIISYSAYLAWWYKESWTEEWACFSTCRCIMSRWWLEWWK